MTPEKAIAIMLKKIAALDETIKEMRAQVYAVEDQMAILEDRFSTMMESSSIFLEDDEDELE